MHTFKLQCIPMEHSAHRWSKTKIGKSIAIKQTHVTSGKLWNWCFTISTRCNYDVQCPITTPDRVTIHRATICLIYLRYVKQLCLMFRPKCALIECELTEETQHKTRNTRENWFLVFICRVCNRPSFSREIVKIEERIWENLREGRRKPWCASLNVKTSRG